MRKLFVLMLFILILPCLHSLDVNVVDNPNSPNKIVVNDNTIVNVDNFSLSTNANYDSIAKGAEEINILKVPEYDTSLDASSDGVKISHTINSKPDNITYEFNYSGFVYWGDWVNYNTLNGSDWTYVDGGYESYYNDTPWLMFNDGSVFDYSDYVNSTAHFSKLRIEPDKIYLVFSVDDSNTYPYVLDPTFGTGTIQNCQTNGYDYCNVTVSSTISGSDFVLNNRGTTIASGVTVRVQNARLTINSSEYFISKSATPFDASGVTHSSGSSGGAGGTGGSAVSLISSVGGANGASNGANGNANYAAPCSAVTGGSGSGFSPFDFASGSAGTFTTSPRFAGGGGFYATGAVLAVPDGSSCQGGFAGGSGNSIKIISANINLSGTTTTNAGSFSSGARGVVGGSGAGELTLYGAYIRFNGTYTATGSAAWVGASTGAATASGGVGGRFRECSKVNYNSTGSSVSLGGGAGAGGGAAGSAGSSTLLSQDSCFPDLIVNNNFDNGTNYYNLTPTLSFNVGSFHNNTGVNCWLNSSGTITSVGTVGFSTSVSEFDVVHTFGATGNYNVNLICGNSSASVTNVTSQLLSIHVTDPLDVSTCENITSGGSYYMSTDLSASGSCLQINTSNVALNCGDHNIVGSGTGVGINISNAANISLYNCSSYNFGTDVLLNNLNATSLSYVSSSTLNASNVRYNVTQYTFIQSSGSTENSTTVDFRGNSSGSYQFKLVNKVPVLPGSDYNWIGNSSLNISTISGIVNLTTISFYYPVSSFDSRFNELWRYNAQTVNLNATNDLVNGKLVINNFVPASTYYILNPNTSVSYVINIFSPSNGTTYVSPYTIPYSVVTDGIGLLLCNASTNGNLISSFNHTLTTSSLTGAIIGLNNFTVSCLTDTGDIVNASDVFNYSLATSTTPFSSAFGLDISTCPVTTYIELVGKCTEYYKIPRVFNFSAVPCLNLNTSLNYSCVTSSVSNVTKQGDYGNNWTIFYTPSYWQYHGAIGVANQSLQLTGAEFIYNNKFITHSADYAGGGMELIDNSSFLYIPAQHKTTDCGYFYSSIFGSNVCSYGYGFITNDRIIAVADEFNQWYTASGVGVSNSSTISSSPVVYVNVIPLAPASDNPFAAGIYTRSSCNVVNTTYVVSLQNTVQQSYLIYIATNVSGIINQTSYYVNSTQLNTVLPITDVTQISIYDNAGLRCSYGQQTTLILPFNFFNGLMTDGYSNIFVKILMLFSVALSSISPFAIIGVLILNDLYHVLSINDISSIFAVAAIAGIINNSYSPERGIKNIVIVIAVTLAYLSVVYPHIESCNGNALSVVMSKLLDLSSVTTANGLADQITGFAIAIVKLFGIMMTLPATIVYLINALLACVLPMSLWTPVSIFTTFIGYGATIWLWLKGYEVVTKQYRGI